MGPYIFDRMDLIDGLGDGNHPAARPVVDLRFGVQCVGLIKTYSKAPRTDLWQKGPSVVSSPDMRKGTAIATFDSRNRYPVPGHGNHTCFFLRFVGDGFEVLEQNEPPNRNMIHRRIIHRRNGRLKPDPYDASSYWVVL